jgi:hypothetical protein
MQTSGSLTESSRLEDVGRRYGILGALVSISCVCALVGWIRRRRKYPRISQIPFGCFTAEARTREHPPRTCTAFTWKHVQRLVHATPQLQAPTRMQRAGGAVSPNSKC